MMHGYMRADDVKNARFLAEDAGIGTTNYLDLVDEVSTSLFTTAIVQLRYQIWVLEHLALGMHLNIDSGGTVQPPTRLGVGANSWDEPSWEQLHPLKRKLELLVRSRLSGWDQSSGSPCTVRGFAVMGAVPDAPEHSFNWWLQYEQHQPINDDPNFGPPPTPPPLWPDQNNTPFIPLLGVAATPQFTVSAGTATNGTVSGNPVIVPAPVVAMSCLTPGATIFYTANNTPPAPGNPMTFAYVTPVTFYYGMTVRAIAVAPPNFLNSPEASITPQQP
jgi:hypothetical protein